MYNEMDRYGFHGMMDGDFSYYGIEALWDFYCELEEERVEPMQFDRDTIRRAWREYEDREDVWKDYHHLFDIDGNDFLFLLWEEIAEMMNDHTHVRVFKNGKGIILQQF